MKRFFSRLRSPINKIQPQFNYLYPVSYKNYVYMITNGNIVKIDLKNIKVERFNLNVEDKEILGGGIYVDDNILVFTVSCGKIYTLNEKNKEIKTIKHYRVILSPPVVYNNRVYFIDIANAIIEYDLNNEKIREFLPKLSNSEIVIPVAPPVITKKYIIYGSTVGTLIIINRADFTAKTIKIECEDIFHINKKPLIIKDKLFIGSDKTIISIDLDKIDNDSNKISIEWSFNKGITCDLMLYKNMIIGADRKDLFFLSLDGQLINTISIDNDILNVMHFDKYIIIIDMIGKIHFLQYETNQMIIGEIPCETQFSPILTNDGNNCILICPNREGEINVWDLFIRRKQ